MKKEGMANNVDFDIGQFMDKTFTTYRKTKSNNETIYFVLFIFDIHLSCFIIEMASWELN
jgi:hypothetical protein